MEKRAEIPQALHATSQHCCNAKLYYRILPSYSVLYYFSLFLSISVGSALVEPRETRQNKLTAHPPAMIPGLKDSLLYNSIANSLINTASSPPSNVLV